MRRILMVLGAVLLLAAAAGCGSKSKSTTSSQGANGNTHSQSTTTGAAAGGKTRLAKTKFVIHAGLAFGAFHRYIYKPFKAGRFAHPASSKLALVKGGVAGIFAYHEVKVALKDAQSSRLLSKLVSPLTALQAKLSALGSALKRGKSDPAAINAANSDVTSIRAQSANAGQPIKDQPTPSLGG